MVLPLEIFSNAFMQDADENVQKLVHSLLAPQPMQYLTEPVPAAPGVPASYAITTEDVSLPPDEWGFMPCLPQRLGDVPIIETPGSHEAKITPARRTRASTARVVAESIRASALT
ncbi:hypothetical protein CJ469_05942 [Nocardia farcinica]|nr:hypothetical protein CJ469_05942 [Nocardia farcinica]PFX04394.1 hypothetical protein CJ468_05558 [Nocardia farcinica]